MNAALTIKNALGERGQSLTSGIDPQVRAAEALQ